MKEGTVILLVDDEEDVRYVLSQTLKKAGIYIVEAANGLEALEYLENNSLPSLIVTDVSMPKMNGWRLIASLKKKSELRNIPIIISSGEYNIDDMAAALEMYCFQKGKEKPDDLLKIVEKVFNET